MVKYVKEFEFPLEAGFSASHSDKIPVQSTSISYFRKGGKVCKQKGGLTQAQDEKEDKKMIQSAIQKHVNAPKPKGHGVGSFKSRPVIKR